VSEAAPRILVVDDDADIARFIELNLRLDGYHVDIAHDGEAAIARIVEEMPDLVLVDVMMPGIDGIELTRRLRADLRTATLPIVILTAKTLTADKVVGLAAGADDYIIKPFDTLELIARVRSTLRRNAEARAVSPLTNLPGNVRILEEIARRVLTGEPLAVAYLDIDNFKAYNDAYGFLRGDEVIQLLASALRSAAGRVIERPFIGHIGGDDFVLICRPDHVEHLSRTIVQLFDAMVPGLHDPEDAARGYLEMVDRQGVLRRTPLVSVSIGVATNERRAFTDHREVVAVATEMKTVAKGEPGSAIAVDRRADSAEELAAQQVLHHEKANGTEG
jgi:diguanylate cyclase (GGDEF)-like protein